MPKRYTSRKLVKLAEEFGWRLVSVKGDHHNFKPAASRFIVTIVHPQKGVPAGRAIDAMKKIKLEVKRMRFLIMLEQTEAGFAVQVPDLAIAAYGENIEAAKRAASEAIRINLATYRECGQQAPGEQPVSCHLENPQFKDLLFAYVEVEAPHGKIAA